MSEKPTAAELEPEETDETKESSEETVSREDYEKLLVEANSHKEKAELLDQLLDDPEFQQFVSQVESGSKETAPPKEPPKKGTTQRTDDLVAKLEEVIEPIKREIESMKSVYQQDQETAWAAEADRQIEAMKNDKEHFPFFEEVQPAMAKLLESGRATSMSDAYMIAAFDKAKAEGRSEVLRKKEAKAKPKVLPGGAAEKREKSKDVFSTGKKSLRDILEDSWDKVGVELVEEDGGD